MKALIKALAVAGVALSATCAATSASAYPDKPIRMIIPYTAGGITDIVGRAIAHRLSDTLGQPVVVENKAGAGGTIGAGTAARSEPDGYTIFLGTSATNGTNPSTFANLKYDPEKDFAPIVLAAQAPLMIIVNPEVPARTLPEFVAYLKANPDTVAYASTGQGGSVHLTTEMFAMKTGTKIRHVSYKGSAPALTDLVGGHVQLMFDNVPSAAPLAKEGKVRALAVTSTERSPLAPDVPTVAETVVPGFESASWIAVYAPAGTPAPIVSDLNKAINVALKHPDLLKTYANAGLQPVGGSPEDLARHQSTEIAKWADVVKTIGYKPQ